MRGTVIYGPRDIRFEDRDGRRRSKKPTDADHPHLGNMRVRVGPVAVPRRCQPVSRTHADGARILRHRRGGRQRGAGSVKPGQFVVGSFATSDNTCPNCRHGYQSSCVQREFMTRAQAPMFARAACGRDAGADTRCSPERPDPESAGDLRRSGHRLVRRRRSEREAGQSPSRSSATARSACSAVLSAKQMGAERIIAMSRHATRQKLAREFGATDIVTERGDEGVARIKDLTNGIGADSVLECVGTQESMMQAIRSRTPGGYVSYVGVPHGVELDGPAAVLRPRPPSRGPGSGAALPAGADRPGAGTRRSIPARCST